MNVSKDFSRCAYRIGLLASLMVLVPMAASAQAYFGQTPWRDNANGTLSTDISWNYAMGYHFSPQVDGRVTQLGGYFNGTKIVRLFEKASGTLLAETEVTAANQWAYRSVKEVPVTAGETYTVAVYLAGSGGSYHGNIDPLPQVYGDIEIEGSTFVSTGSDPQARPTNTVPVTMYGQADIRFKPGAASPPACSGLAADLRVNGLEWRASHGEWQIKFNDCPQGSTCEVNLTLENTGTSTIPMLAIDLDRDVFYDDYLILDHGCGFGLLPGGTCAVDLMYEMPVGVARTNPGALIFRVGKNRASGGDPDITSVTFDPLPVDASGPDSMTVRVCAEDDLPGSDLCD